MSTVRRVIMWALAVAVFVFTWLLRFNDPGGSFAGLTDDHFFYLARGWQILFGDLPVRDFVDHGAPLYYYVGAAVQVLFGRGTVSEVAFSRDACSRSAPRWTFWLAAEASGWIALGARWARRFTSCSSRASTTIRSSWSTRWRFRCCGGSPIGRRRGSRFWIAVVTVVGFLFRHDHGVFVGLAMAVAIAAARRARRGGSASGTRWSTARSSCALLLPYFAFIEFNGGVVSYFRQASAWAEQDRNRAPVVFPGLFDNPDGVSDAAREGGPLTPRRGDRARQPRGLDVLRRDRAAAARARPDLGRRAAACRPAWPHARAKLTMVAVLALVLDACFLRSPLAARLADPSVPLAILVAWLCVALPQVLRPSRWRWPAGAAGAGALRPPRSSWPRRSRSRWRRA